MVSTAVLLALGALDLPMPPPPPGMVVVAQLPPAAVDGGQPAAVEPRASAPAPAPTPDDDDAELDELRALEEASIDPSARSDAALRLNLSRLGYGTLLRDSLEGALAEAEASGEELPFELAPVTDVAAFDVSLVRDRYDIPVEMHPLVAQYIRFFQGAGRRWFRRWMNRSSRYLPLMQPILEEKGLPRDTVYVAMIESGFNTQAKSWARAVGPWQFISGTAKMFNLREDFWVDERRDPVKATRAAADYLSLLYQNTGHWYLAWAGYNTGGGRVRMMVQKYGTTDFWRLSEGKGFARETKHYVPKLIACALVAKHPEAFGFSPDEFEFEPPLEWDEVQLEAPVDLEVLALSAGTTVEDIRALNPELKHWATPPATEKEPYTLRVPAGRRDTFVANFTKYAPSERLNFRVHRVKKGDTLSKIAQSYRSAPEAIMRMNGLNNPRALKVGVDLLVPVPSAGALKAGRSDVALERQVARARRSGLAAARPEEEIPAGTGPATKVAVGGSIAVDKVEGRTRVTYGVARGDTLWSIARRFDVRVADLRAWNTALGSSARGLKVGTSLLVWPGPAAELPGGTKATGRP